MGLGSHTQTNDRVISPGNPVTGPCSGSGPSLNAGPAADGGPRGSVATYPLGTASEDACTGRAARTLNVSRRVLMPLGGVA